MESTFTWVYLIGSCISIVTLICFFNLCINVSKLRKHFEREDGIITGHPLESIDSLPIDDSIDKIRTDYEYDKFHMKLKTNQKAQYRARLSGIGFTDEQIANFMKK